MNNPPRISAIAAMARNRVIGIDNAMPWHLPEDLKIFKARTMNKPVIMGRKTFESVLAHLGRPMPGRHSIVVSRGDYAFPGINVHADIDGALAEARAYAAQNNIDEIIIGGGAQIYALALPVTDRIYLTVVDADYDGDSYFPALDDSWCETAREMHDGFHILTLDRQ